MKKQLRTEHLTVRLTLEERAELERIADAQTVSLGAVMRQGVVFMLAYYKENGHMPDMTALRSKQVQP